jgi:hypothetical protein
MTDVLFSNKSCEWYTPPRIVAAVKEVLGENILDPCAPEDTVMRQFPRVFTRTDDGLAQPWRGAFYCNPPSGRGQPKAFWDKACREIRVERAPHGMFMCYNIEQVRTLGALVFPICIPYKRLQFSKPDGTPGEVPRHSNAIIYMPGIIDRRTSFADAFRSIGQVRI